MTTPAYRVLHIVGPHLERPSRDRLATLLTVGDQCHRVLTLGRPAGRLLAATSYKLSSAAARLAPAAPWLLRRAIRRLLDGREAPVVVHAWGDSLPPSVICALAAGWATVVQVDSIAAARRLGRLARRLGHKAVLWVCPTDILWSHLSSSGVACGQLARIRGSFDPARLAAVDRNEARERLGLAHSDVAVAVLGSQVVDKPAFMAAWAGMLAEKIMSRLRLVIPLGGREAERVRYLAKCCRHEHMFRFANNLDPVELASVADLALYLPKTDANSEELIWAMAVGCPIVASDLAATRELLTPSQTAWLCRPGDPRDAARAIVMALEAPEQTRRYVQKARLLATELFDRTRMLAEYDRVYRALAERTPSYPAATSTRPARHSSH